MEINSITSGINSSNAYNTRTSDVKANSSDEISENKTVSEAEKLNAFKQDFYKMVSALPYNRNEDISIQITDGAFKRMMNDPKFKADMIDTLQRDAAATNESPCGTTLTRIDENGYSGYAYTAENEAAFSAHSSDKDSFYSRKGKKKHKEENAIEELDKIYKQKAIDKEYHDKLAQNAQQYQDSYISKMYGQNIGFLQK